MAQEKRERGRESESERASDRERQRQRDTESDALGPLDDPLSLGFVKQMMKDDGNCVKNDRSPGFFPTCAMWTYRHCEEMSAGEDKCHTHKRGK